MEKKYRNWLIAIFLITLTIRLILAFTIPNFTYDSYFHLRQVEHITETGLPLYEDQLSYGGRKLIYLPFFHYLIALFNLILPLELIAKILPNILIASLTIITFLISKKITNNETAALISSFITGFLPILYFTNAFIPETFFLPLVFLTIYSFLNINKKKHLSIFITSLLVLSLTSSDTILIIMGFILYIILSAIENKKILQKELEIIIFSLFFYVWSQFLFYKEILLEEGISFIWQNVPRSIITQYFPKLPLGEAILMVSIIPFVAGIYVVYKSLFHLKNQKSFLLISFVISTSILSWLRFIKFKHSLAFFGIILAILFSSFYQEIYQSINKTKLAHLRKYFLPLTVIILTVTMIYPAINFSIEQNTPTNNEISAFQWIEKNTAKDTTIATTLEEGHLVTFISKRKNLMDDQFSLIKDVEKRSTGISAIFERSFQTEVINLFDEYQVKYLVLTPSARKRYNIKNKFSYIDGECFKRIYKNETRIYLVKCTLTNT